MLLFGEWYLLLYVYIVLQVLLHILTHTIILFPEVCYFAITFVIQIMCTLIIVVIKYYMDCIIKYCLMSISWMELLELMIRTYMHQIHNKLEHKYARHYKILMKEAIIMYVTTYVGSDTEY